MTADSFYTFDKNYYHQQERRLKMDWILKCVECDSEYKEDEILPTSENPSGIMEQVCPCGGSLELLPVTTPPPNETKDVQKDETNKRASSRA